MSAFSHDRKSNRLRYNRLESAILDFFTHEDWAAVIGDGECPGVKAAKSELETILNEIGKISRRIEIATAAMDEAADVATIKVLAEKIAKDQSALLPLMEQKDSLQAKVEAERAKCLALHEPSRLLDLVKSNSPEANEVRLRLRMEIQKRVARINLMFVPDSRKSVVVRIAYINGVVRHAWLDAESSILVWDKDRNVTETKAR
jgi:hypothetical protein